ncbi:hypothetical protein [Arthrobacter sp. UYCu712]|uniref:hypothetical protein n=1 Tax=Arthrobacter sp. UYCu712 TaxID=3156340 RepID=UPI00339A4AFA
MSTNSTPFKAHDELNRMINSEKFSILMNNYNLIASNSEDNLKALRFMKKLVRQ